MPRRYACHGDNTSGGACGHGDRGPEFAGNRPAPVSRLQYADLFVGRREWTLSQTFLAAATAVRDALLPKLLSGRIQVSDAWRIAEEVA